MHLNFIQVDGKEEHTKSFLRDTGGDQDPALLHIELVPADESQKRMRAICASLEKRSPGGSRFGVWASGTEIDRCGTEIIEELFTLLLLAHYKVGHHTSPAGIPLMVPWDPKTGLPSHPSLTADARTCADEEKDISPGLRALLGSFSGWSVFAKETFRCACGGGMTLREIPLEIVVHTALGTGTAYADRKALAMTTFIGIRSQVSSHLDHHYAMSSPSNAAGDIRIVNFTNALVFPPDTSRNGYTQTTGSILSDMCSKQFARDLFLETLKKGVHSFATTGKEKNA
ncbi:MAG: hypothetical protein A3I44_02270 [Candidatus Sungbacteria bacterium RIFCSPLOWO2_02_FULL_51_17]|nr:MAG: hypothetical protein A2676_01945 [Candidatus Sungbacteria bacterium RIFCSPHIGHO2_01_FULL_51_22]OHA12019.1 MAG: hypothetical protein A3I44_02270 [Candidatus Sungbacteria bacterium RIFCSPLOWO2_02_FULL_51_17]